MAPVHFLPRPLQPLQRAEAQRQPLQAVARATELATDPVPGRKTMGFPRGKPGEKDGKGQKPRGKARKQWENQGKPWNEWVEIDRKQNEWVTCLNHKKYLSMGDEHLPI